MNKPKITIHDAITGETIVREMTDQEIVELEKRRTEITVIREEIKEELAASAAVRASTLEKLVALGLTEEEAAEIIK